MVRAGGGRFPMQWGCVNRRLTLPPQRSRFRAAPVARSQSVNRYPAMHVRTLQFFATNLRRLGGSYDGQTHGRPPGVTGLLGVICVGMRGVVLTPSCATVASSSMSKWLKSGGRKTPPQRCPINCHSRPMRAQRAGSVRLAGWSPTRRSTARAGDRTCFELGADGLMRSCSSGDRWPLMTLSPGQRNPVAEKPAATRASKETSATARARSIDHRLDSSSGSVPTRLANAVLAKGDGKHAQQHQAVVNRIGRGRRPPHEFHR